MTWINRSKLKIEIEKLGGKKLFLYLGPLVLASVLTGVADFRTAKTERKIPSESSSSLDILIPSGFVLVPIEVQNFESLDSILGQYGVVDLYQPALQPKGKARLIVKGIRIVRSPKNPSLLAALAPESQAPDLVRTPGPFLAVVQNRKRTGMNFVKVPHKRKREITLEMEE